MHRMGQLVKNNVPHQMLWQKHQLIVQAEGAAGGVAAPAGFLRSDSQFLIVKPG